MIFIFDAACYGALGLLLVTLGALISIRFLSFPDLTIDGSFTLAACLYARLISAGNPEWFSIGVAASAGGAAGLCTVALNEGLGIGKLLASVAVMIVCISSAPYILGRATIGLLAEPTTMNRFNDIDTKLTATLFKGSAYSIHLFAVIGTFGLVILLGALIYLLARTRIGVAIRYFGSSQSATNYLTNSSVRAKLAALGLGNTLVGLGGIIEAQRRGSADQGMGLGITLAAVSSLIVGESLLRMRNRFKVLGPGEEVAAALLGALVYSLMITAVIHVTLGELDTRILSSLALISLLAITHSRRKRTDELF